MTEAPGQWMNPYGGCGSFKQGGVESHDGWLLGKRAKSEIQYVAFF